MNRSMKSFFVFRNRLFLQPMLGDIPDDPYETNRMALPSIIPVAVSVVKYVFPLAVAHRTDPSG